jgi:uncharacterized MnhB-related membrane protein
MEIIWYVLAAAGALACAILAISAKRLLVSAIWLAGCSALVALLMYLLGAPEIAVIELSVGAGLVTVLFVFAINIAGDESTALPVPLPKPIPWVLVIGLIALIGWLVIAQLSDGALAGQGSDNFYVALWSQRYLDVLLQVAIIFAGVLGMMGLLAEGKKRHVEETPGSDEEKA